MGLWDCKQFSVGVQKVGEKIKQEDMEWTAGGDSKEEVHFLKFNEAAP